MPAYQGSADAEGRYSRLRCGPRDEHVDREAPRREAGRLASQECLVSLADGVGEGAWPKSSRGETCAPSHVVTVNLVAVGSWMTGAFSLNSTPAGALSLNRQ